jgi:hypothetical protein
MNITELFLAELDREAKRSRRVLEQVPGGNGGWKPHEKSMTFGYLAELVALMPSWVAMAISKDELDLRPPVGPEQPIPKLDTSAELLAALDKSVTDARTALQGTTDQHLDTPWRLLVAGTVVMEASRHEVIQDTFNHAAHHRGQLTVYLRLIGAKVPATYGPSADDRSFA